MPQNFLFKLIIVGDVAVGKSCLLLQFLERTFVPDHDVTLGVEFGTKAFVLNGQQVKLHIWDTAGLETFRSITRSYYRGAAGALLVYDVTRRQTFEGLHEWVQDLQKYGTPDLVVTVVGNKCDRPDRQVSRDEGEMFARENHFNFFECSAKTGENVDEAFIGTSRIILSAAEEAVGPEEPDDDVVKPEVEKPNNGGGGGCPC
ncbi:Rab2a [Monocercomonoides exilis]|uniref:Rab2a n=1 Tax=Monocercomonoides exilis TaxID=2049356 RepID=UPI00355A5142|nr:Rab2a [Monocercomonoides exilis]|eukprot:MONOS_755.1-p1 / transcript=MONOS_755.1 / gene=MONOS_755 / organism=Monocercomonoides_exilis_PA203 / gene_product=Rab2a / transcript_product=Rab2a / location=Mono_scaffold00012:245231-246144(-) / protein_length=202 / sequence_SO=supercontig / SO=protein_coding / is_pseudo=false